MVADFKRVRALSNHPGHCVLLAGPRPYTKNGWKSLLSDDSHRAGHLKPMLRLTKKADYGLMALKYLAEQAAIAAPHAVRSPQKI